VIGYATDAVERQLADAYTAAAMQVLDNPFYEVADNLASCWLARGLFHGDTILHNGDTVFEPAMLAHLLTAPPTPIRLAVDHQAAYDDDDMKVSLADDRLVRVGKTLGADITHGESIGMLRFD